MLRRTLALSALTLLAAAAPAGAATFASGLNLTMTPFAGESNQLILGLTTSGADTFWVVTRENTGAAPVNAGSSCTQVTTNAQVRCEITGIASLSLGDGDDRVTKTANGHGAIINGESGADTLVVRDTAAATLNGGPDNDYLEAVGPLVDTLNGDAGDDQLRGGAGADVINGGPGNDTFLVAGGTWTVSLDDVANDGVSPVANVHSDVENITGDQFGDTLTGSAAANVLRGGGGNDTLDGKGGADQLFGDGGNDTINARDGIADTIDCGDGADSVVADVQDVLSGCETVAYADADGDTFAANVDCDDANPAIHPGAIDLPGNGVDEDCSGADTPKPEATATPTPTATATPVATASPAATATPVPTPHTAFADATPTPAPTTTAAPTPLDSIVTATFSFARRYTLFNDITIRNARAGSTILLRCTGKGCPKSIKPITIARDAAKLTLKRPLGKAKLRVGTRFEVRIQHPGNTTVITRYTVRPNRAPARKDT
ncbi:MopE-related protein [Solirubrobacter ginsenosidimutans]|uniref:MopE-related protein n=1 Tax=Solirubrobacter ginsenosidimutans TaxID=490573 RepID=A0A9X3S2G9_9ACTN|nr:MopE-related protein [Solirubrobacter ginsenosidimutans]MDA0163529.1 MopE-related protein [Solirubrobacter ginsenosidimutans]